MICLVVGLVVLSSQLVGANPSAFETTNLDKCSLNYLPCKCENVDNQQLIETLIDVNSYEHKYNLPLLMQVFNSEATPIIGSMKSNSGTTNHMVKHNCKNKNISSVINCSDHQIKIIPKFKTLGYSKQPTIDCLDLSHNQIEMISESVFYGMIFKCIDFSFNKIFKVSRNALSGLLNSLFVLKFDHNEMTSSSLPAYFISKLTQLQVFYMSNNKITKIPDKSFLTVFESRLRVLDLSNNQIDCIADDAFLGLSHLTYLNLCHNDIGGPSTSNCTKSETLQFGFLKHLGSLENLHICSNDLNQILGGFENFKLTPRLKVVNLENNQLRNLRGIMCPYTPNTSQQSTYGYLKSLESLNLARNFLSDIEQTDFECLTSLRELNLEHNLIDSLATHSFKNMKHLSTLRLGGNSLFALQPPGMLSYLKNSLTHLSLSVTRTFYSSSFKLDKYTSDLIRDQQLASLQRLDIFDLSAELVDLNLAELILFKKNKLRRVSCFNCTIQKIIIFEYATGHNNHSKLDEEIEEFNENLKANVCPYSTLADQPLMTIEFSENDKKIDQECMNKHYQTAQCNKKQYFIGVLLNHLKIEGVRCLNREANSDWFEFQRDMYEYKKKQLQSSVCLNRTLPSVDCRKYVQHQHQVSDLVDRSNQIRTENRLVNSAVRQSHRFNLTTLIVCMVVASRLLF